MGAPAGDSFNLWGVAAGLAAAASYAVMTNSGTKLAALGYNPNHILASSFSLGALLLLPFVITGGTWFASPSGLVAIMWLGLFVTTLAYVLFGVGLKHLMPGTIATLNLGEPLVATILAIAFLGESLSAIGWVGFLLILVALGLLARATAASAAGSKDMVTHV